MDSSSFELNLEQEFQMRLMEESVDKLSREQMQDLLIQASRLLMVKENMIRYLLRSCGL